MSLKGGSRLLLPAVTLASAVLALVQFDILQVGGTVDDAYYIVLAESIAEGRGFSLINFPDAPIQGTFSPGWPLLLSFVHRLFPGNFLVFKLVSMALWLATVPLVYLLFRARLGSPYSEIHLVLVATNFLLAAISSMLMSESAYLFFSMLTLVLFALWEGRLASARDWLIPAIAVSAVYTQLIRSIGISLVLALLTYLLIRRRVRQFALMSVCMALAFVPQIWLNAQREGVLFSGGYESMLFGGSLGAGIGQAIEQLLAYAQGPIGEAVVMYLTGPRVVSLLGGYGLHVVPFLVNLAILGLLLLGAFISVTRHRLAVSGLYVFFYFAGILAFRDPSMGLIQPRFLIPLIPFLYLYLIEGIRALVSAIPGTLGERLPRPAIVGLAALIVPLSLVANVQGARNPVRNRTTDISVGGQWIQTNADPDAIVMTRDPVPRYLYLQRRTVDYPDRAQDIGSYLHENGVDYILVAPLLQSPRTTQLDGYMLSVLLPYLDANPEDFRARFQDLEHAVTIYDVHMGNDTTEHPRSAAGGIHY